MKLFFAFAAIIATASVAAPAVARPVLVAAVPLIGAPEGAKAYRVVYHSTDGGGKAVDVTGVVIVPAARAPGGRSRHRRLGSRHERDRQCLCAVDQ